MKIFKLDDSDTHDYIGISISTVSANAGIVQSGFTKNSHPITIKGTAAEGILYALSGFLRSKNFSNWTILTLAEPAWEDELPLFRGCPFAESASVAVKGRPSNDVAAV